MTGSDVTFVIIFLYVSETAGLQEGTQKVILQLTLLEPVNHFLVVFIHPVEIVFSFVNGLLGGADGSNNLIFVFIDQT